MAPHEEGGPEGPPSSSLSAAWKTQPPSRILHSLCRSGPWPRYRPRPPCHLRSPCLTTPPGFVQEIRYTSVGKFPIAPQVSRQDTHPIQRNAKRAAGAVAKQLHRVDLRGALVARRRCCARERARIRRTEDRQVADVSAVRKSVDVAGHRTGGNVMLQFASCF